MKEGIHPAYNEINVICACGHRFETRSTHKGDIRVEICSSCHPFFTGKQKLIDTAGRIDKFERKYKAIRGDKDKQNAAAGKLRKRRAAAVIVRPLPVLLLFLLMLRRSAVGQILVVERLLFGGEDALSIFATAASCS